MRFPSFCFAAVGLAFAPTVRAAPQQSAPAVQQPSSRLESGRAVERAITARQVDTFRIALDSGAMGRVALTQGGIDLVTSVFGPGGENLAEVDDTPDGPDTEAKVVARHAGDHRIQIRAVDATAAPGRYSLTVEVVSRDEVAALRAADRSRRATVSMIWNRCAPSLAMPTLSHSARPLMARTSSLP